MPIYNLGSADNAGIQDRLGTATDSSGSVQGRLAALIALYGALNDAAGTTSSSGLLARLLAIANAIDGLEGSLGDAVASPAANSLHARIQSIVTAVDGLETSLGDAVASPAANSLHARIQSIVTTNATLAAAAAYTTSATTAVSVTTTGTALCAAAIGSTLARLITMQNVSGASLDIYNGTAATGVPRIKAMPVGVAYELNFRGALFGITTSGTATVNVSLDT